LRTLVGETHQSVHQINGQCGGFAHDGAEMQIAQAVAFFGTFT
jgi:hypothetical protein